MRERKEDILFFAFRYAIYRNTYAVDIIIEEITNSWKDLSDFAKKQFKHEIELAFKHLDIYGKPKDDWKKILELN